MLSIGKVNAIMAADYYKAEKNYYDTQQNPADRWQGKLCNNLGLKDGELVKPEQLQTLLEGHERAGFDLTFSADKSVSIAAEMNDATRQDMLEAHRAAVSKTLEKIEAESGTRVRGIDGNPAPQFVKTGNLAIAKIEHETSRALDPDLHTHCVIANKTAYNNEIYSLDARQFYVNKMRYGLEYRCELAKQLQARGYEVELTDGEKGLFELRGIKPEVREHFSKRRQEIEQTLKERGEVGGEAADRAEQYTRKAKQQVDLNDQRAKWRDEMTKLGQEPIKPTTDGSKIDIQTQQAQALGRAVERLSAKQFAFTNEQLEKAAMQEGVTCGVDSEKARELISNDKQLIRLTPRQDSGLQGDFLTTQKNLDLANGIESMTARGRGVRPCMTETECENTLQAACKENNWKLGEQQTAVVKHIATSKDRFLAVRGLAGTGKTFTLNAAREVLERQGFTVKGMSATGQAAQELSADAKIADCGTIHHQLNAAEKAAGNAIPGQDYTQKSSWNFDGATGNGKTVWFCDEASLTDNNLFYHIQKMSEATGAKVVFVGDDKQMLAVGQGNAFGELVQRNEIATCELSNIVRQKDSPQLLKAVRQAVNGKTKVSLDIISKDIKEIPTRGRRLNAVAKEYCNLSAQEQKETLVLTAKNADRVYLNEKIRAGLIKSGRLEQGQEVTIQPDEKKAPELRRFAPGDKMTFLKNDGKLGVMNGTKGTVRAISGNNMTVDVGKGKSVTFDFTKYKAFDHAYCVTPHKGQGMTVQRAIINLDSKDAALNSKNSYYVDISRAKQNVKLFCDSREKLEPQLDKFARKISKRDFKTPNAKPVKFRGLSPRGGKPFGGGIANKAVQAAGKATAAAIKAASGIVKIIPIVGKIAAAPLDVTASLAKTSAKITAAGVKVAGQAAKTGVETGLKVAQKAGEQPKQPQQTTHKHKLKI